MTRQKTSVSGEANRYGFSDGRGGGLTMVRPRPGVTNGGTHSDGLKCHHRRIGPFFHLCWPPDPGGLLKPGDQRCSRR